MGRGGMNVQFAELAAEGEMLLRRDVLVAEEDHEIFGERAMDLVHRRSERFDERACDIDAGNLRADDRGQFFDADGLIGLGFAGDVPIARALLAGQRTHGRSSRSCCLQSIVAWMARSAIHPRGRPGVRRDDGVAYSAAVTGALGAAALP